MRKVNENASPDGPISTLHDEIIAMIFEAGALEELAPECTFAFWVSHTTRRWRNIALATPRLWTKTWCTKPLDWQISGSFRSTPYPVGEKERLSAFLSRSTSKPVEIHIRFLCRADLASEGWTGLLQLICKHMGHCSHLYIKDGDDDGLPELLSHISRRPAPLLRSVELGIEEDYDPHQLTDLSILAGAPNLISANLNRIAFAAFLSSLPSLQYVTSLRLSVFFRDDEIGGESFGKALMALKALNHLELEMLEKMATLVPVVLPTVRSLALSANYYDEISNGFIFALHAPSATTLSLEYWPLGLDLALAESLEPHFPALQHLILVDVWPKRPIIPVVARIFPHIVRLTCCSSPHRMTANSEYVLADMHMAPSENVNESTGLAALCWPKLECIALANVSLAGGGLRDKVRFLQDAGHTLRTLLLPVDMLYREKEEDIVELERFVEIGEFRPDWLAPFVRSEFPPIWKSAYVPYVCIRVELLLIRHWWQNDGHVAGDVLLFSFLKGEVCTLVGRQFFLQLPDCCDKETRFRPVLPQRSGVHVFCSRVGPFSSTSNFSKMDAWASWYENGHIYSGDYLLRGGTDLIPMETHNL